MLLFTLLYIISKVHTTPHNDITITVTFEVLISIEYGQNVIELYNIYNICIS